MSTSSGANAGAADRASHDLTGWYAAVHDLCVARLADAHSAATGLFDRQLLDGRWQPTTEREALSSTAIALIGIARSGTDPATIAVDPLRTMDALARATVAAGDLRSIGLTLWANAVHGGVDAATLLARVETSLAECEDLVGGLTTMEVAWLVTGLAHEADRAHDSRVGAVLASATDELVRRYDPRSRLFAHAGPRAPFADRVRANVPNFADEIYSVFALSSLARQGARSWDIPRAAAARIAVLQGPRGEWWWHYNARRSTIARHFSVYSVHQHAMAPMTLFAADDAADPQFGDAIAASVAWIDANQSERSMIDTEAGTIWRSLDASVPRLVDVAAKARGLAGLAAPSGPTHRFALNRETRPYEWAWCLFAEAALCGPGRAGHLV